ATARILALVRSGSLVRPVSPAGSFEPEFAVGFLLCTSWFIPGSIDRASARAKPLQADGTGCRGHSPDRVRRPPLSDGPLAAIFGNSSGNRLSDLTSFNTTLERTCVTPGSLNIVSCRKRS